MWSYKIEYVDIQNRISGFSTESVLKPLILFCDWRGLIKESPR